MKLLRVQVPEFRALKDVDISFEPDFKPNIFPLASQNGGGKSTLIQLIFVCLSALGNSKIKHYAKNLLSPSRIQKKDNILLEIDLLFLDTKEVSLEFGIFDMYLIAEILLSHKIFKDEKKHSIESRLREIKELNNLGLPSLGG